MKRDLVGILACPTDKAPLEIAVQLIEGDDIVTGQLTCSQCSAVYQIENSVPNLLPVGFGSS